MKNATDLILAPMLMSAMTEGAAAYTMQQIRISHSKPRRGCVVGCRVCGAFNVTLYKDGEDRICGRCRAVMEEGGDDVKGSPDKHTT